MSEPRHDAVPTWRASLLVGLRIPILLAWVAAAVAAVVHLPSLAEADSASVRGLVAADAEAIATEERDFELFELPLLSRTVVVQRAPDGIGADAQARALARAQDLTEGRDPVLRTIRFALPVANTAGLFPGSTERGTTILTFLYFEPGASVYARTALGRTVASRIGEDGDPVTGVTGAIPARVAEWRAIEDALPWVELLTVGFIALLIGWTFRSVGAPLVVLAAAGVAYLVATRAVAWMGTALDISVPREVEPVMLVLLLGVVTDYAVFFLATFRRALAAGATRVEAARVSVTANAGVVATAGLIVALGSAALIVGRLDFFRALGPAAGLTVLLALLVCLTFVPAARDTSCVSGRPRISVKPRRRSSAGSAATASAAAATTMPSAAPARDVSARPANARSGASSRCGSSSGTCSTFRNTSPPKSCLLYTSDAADE